MKETENTFDKEAYYRKLDKEYDLEWKKWNIMLSEYDWLIENAKYSKPTDIVLIGYAISKIQESWMDSTDSFYRHMSQEHNLDSTYTDGYIDIYTSLTEFDHVKNRPVLREEFIGYSLEQLMTLVSANEYQRSFFNKEMSIRKMRKIKYSLEIFPEFDPTTLPDTEAEENEILNMIIDPKLKSRIRQSGNLKDNLLEYCEKRIRTGVAHISVVNKLQGYLEIGAFLCEIEKYHLYNQADNIYIYCLQEFAMSTEFVIKCISFFDRCGKMNTDTYKPKPKNRNYNVFSEENSLNELYRLWRG